MHLHWRGSLWDWACSVQCPQAEFGIARNPAHHNSTRVGSKRRLSLSVRRALRNHSCQSTGWAQVPNHWDLLWHRLCVNCNRGRHSERLRITSCSGSDCLRQLCMVNTNITTQLLQKTYSKWQHRKQLKKHGNKALRWDSKRLAPSEPQAGSELPAAEGWTVPCVEEAAAAGSPAAHTDP